MHIQYYYKLLKHNFQLYYAYNGAHICSSVFLFNYRNHTQVTPKLQDITTLLAHSKKPIFEKVELKLWPLLNDVAEIIASYNKLQQDIRLTMYRNITINQWPPQVSKENSQKEKWATTILQIFNPKETRKEFITLFTDSDDHEKKASSVSY